MKRRTFIKGTTSTIAGIGFPAIHSFQSQFKIVQNPFDTFVTMDKEKVSFYSDVIKEKIKIIHIADTHLYMDDIIQCHIKITVAAWQTLTIKQFILKQEKKQIPKKLLRRQ